MKKLVIIGWVVFSSCQNNTEVPVQESAPINDTILTVDSIKADTIAEKINSLLVSTKDSDKKVKEIKAIKKENKALKKELVETKAELNQMKAILEDTTSEGSKKKKTFLQKVISTIKNDSAQ